MKAQNIFVALIVSILAGPGPTRAQGGDPIVSMQTTKGPIVIRVYRSMVPNTASNFLELVGRGFYNGLSFHRVESWCIQGGDPNGNGSGDFVDPQTGRPRYLPLEINRSLHHRAGAVAMARSNDPNSASCQFYITKSSVPQLDGKYAIFGDVIDGFNTVRNISVGDRIISMQIGNGNSGGAPMQSSAPSSYHAPGRYNSNVRSNAGTPTDSGF